MEFLSREQFEAIMLLGTAATEEGDYFHNYHERVVAYFEKLSSKKITAIIEKREQEGEPFSLHLAIYSAIASGKFSSVESVNNLLSKIEYTFIVCQYIIFNRKIGLEHLKMILPKRNHFQTSVEENIALAKLAISQKAITGEELVEFLNLFGTPGNRPRDLIIHAANELVFFINKQ